MSETAGPDFAAITERQQQVWSSGDFNVIAIATMSAAEMLVEAVNPHAGDRVLDVACGSGNLALIAARRYCEVTGIDTSRVPAGGRDPGLRRAVRQGRRGCTNARRTATVLPATNRAVIRTRRSG